MLGIYQRFWKGSNFNNLTINCIIHFIFRKSILNVTDVDNFISNLLNPNFKGAYLASKDSVLYSNHHQRNNGTLKVCNEILYNRQFGIYYPKPTFLQKIFDEKLHQFMQHGFIEEWVSRYTETDDAAPPKQPKQIKLIELLGLYKLLLIGLVLSALVFCLEFSSLKYESIKKLFG